MSAYDDAALLVAMTFRPWVASRSISAAAPASLLLSPPRETIYHFKERRNMSHRMTHRPKKQVVFKSQTPAFMTSKGKRRKPMARKRTPPIEWRWVARLINPRPWDNIHVQEIYEVVNIEDRAWNVTIVNYYGKRVGLAPYEVELFRVHPDDFAIACPKCPVEMGNT